MSANILNVTPETLQSDVFNARQPVLLDLWAPWCAPCRALAPALDKLAANAGKGLQVAKLDVEQYPEMMQELKVRGIPALLLIKDGEEISREVGTKTLAQLTHWLTKNNVELNAANDQPRNEALYPAFYGDQQLKAFLCQRLDGHGQQGDITSGRTPDWQDGKGTLSAALVHSADSAVFNRLSGLPIAMAPAFDFVRATEASVISGFCDALQAGTDLSRVPAQLIKALLEAPAADWPGLLQHSPLLNTLRIEWLEICTKYLEGKELSQSQCSDLKARAKTLQNSPDRAVQRTAKLLQAVTPMPPASDEGAWSEIFVIAGWLLFPVAQHHAGWSFEDRETEGRRDQWFSERQARTVTGKFTEEELVGLRAQWNQENHEYQEKERAFFGNDIQGLAPICSQLQTRLTQLLATAPQFPSA